MTLTQNTTPMAVIGSGYMGGGIAQTLAIAGHPVRLADRDGHAAEEARLRLTAQARAFEAQGLLPSGSADLVEQNLSAADSIEEAVAGASYITEAAPETLELKLAILGRVCAAAPQDAIIGTNTSAIPIANLAEGVTNPGRFLGVHWMNPAPFIPCVELIATTETAPHTVDAVEALMRRIGKSPIRVADTAGFVANRLQFALYKEAARMVEEGVATPQQIDDVVSNSFGFRLALFGPFAIGDMAGLDVFESAFKTLEKTYGERFAPPALLSRTVAAGNLGLKSGRGVRDIAEADHQALLAYRDKAYARLAQLRTDLGKAPGL
jgi:3-hydroxybutyryl-CoA dehydrogenase